jgi:plastocyanin
MGFRRALLALLAVFLLAGCSEERGALVVDDPEATETDYDYLIPAGTAERITAGETVEILPAQLTVKVGEVIRIVNEDTAGHFVGIFYVGPGETVTQRFASPGEFSGLCTIHPSGQISLTVEN